MVLATRVGLACLRVDPEEEGERAAGDREVERGDPGAGAERRDLRAPPESALATTSAAAPAVMPAVRKPSALERITNGRDQTL